MKRTGTGASRADSSTTASRRRTNTTVGLSRNSRAPYKTTHTLIKIRYRPCLLLINTFVTLHKHFIQFEICAFEIHKNMNKFNSHLQAPSRPLFYQLSPSLRIKPQICQNVTSFETLKKINDMEHVFILLLTVTRRQLGLTFSVTENFSISTFEVRGWVSTDWLKRERKKYSSSQSLILS